MQACSKITGILPGSPPEGQNWSSTRHLRFAPKTIQCEVEGETIAHQCPLLLFTDKQRSRATKLGFATEDFMPAIPHAMVYVLQQRFLHWVGQKRPYGYHNGDLCESDANRSKFHYTAGTPGADKPAHHPGITPIHDMQHAVESCALGVLLL